MHSVFVFDLLNPGIEILKLRVGGLIKFRNQICKLLLLCCG